MAIKRIPAPQGFVVESPAERDALVGGTGSIAAVEQGTVRSVHRAMNAGDGTRQLLVSGVWMMVAGLAAWLLTVFMLGGVGPQGAHSNAGWLALMVAMMCTPFAILLLALGGAKWLRNRGRSKARVR